MIRSRVKSGERRAEALDKMKGCGKGRNYESRNKFLKELGFACYAHYLKSSLWQSVRAEVFRLKGTDCHLCGKPATAVHHNRYHIDDLIGKCTRFLIPICGPCHREVEFNSKQKLTLKQAKNTSKKIRVQHVRENPEVRWSGVPNRFHPMPFGRCKGTKIKDLKEEYLVGILNSKDPRGLDDALRAVLVRELETRNKQREGRARAKARRRARKAAILAAQPDPISSAIADSDQRIAAFKSPPPDRSRPL